MLANEDFWTLVQESVPKGVVLDRGVVKCEPWQQILEGHGDELPISVRIAYNQTSDRAVDGIVSINFAQFAYVKLGIINESGFSVNHDIDGFGEAVTKEEIERRLSGLVELHEGLTDQILARFAHDDICADDSGCMELRSVVERTVCHVCE